MMEPGSELMRRETIVGLVNVYQNAVKQIEECFGILDNAQKQIRTVFANDHIDIEVHSSYRSWEEPNRTIETLQRDCWRAIIERSEIRRYLTEKRARELSKEIDSGAMPPLTTENVWNVMQSGLANVKTFAEELIYETWKDLRPHYTKYKTNLNLQNEDSDRAILAGTLRPGYGKNKFTVSSYWENTLRQIQNAFMILDGKGFGGAYYGELVDSIRQSETGSGETEYFIWKGYRNQNLHIKFRRMDLVAKMNQIVGGMALKHEKE